MTGLFVTSSLAFAAYWAVPELRRDLDILIRCGGVQANVASRGCDTPAGWFYQAAKAYCETDDVGRLGRFACTRVAMSFEEGRAS